MGNRGELEIGTGHFYLVEIWRDGEVERSRSLDTEDEMLAFGYPSRWDDATKIRCYRVDKSSGATEPLRDLVGTRPSVGVPGLFTPGGEVLCWTCHGEAWRYGRTGLLPDWERERLRARRAEDGEAITTCQECRARVVIRSDVARLHNFALACNDATDGEDDVPALMLIQSGGMCANLEATVIPDGRYLCVCDAEDDFAEFGIGLYENIDAFADGHDPIAYREVVNQEQAIAAVRELTREAEVERVDLADSGIVLRLVSRPGRYAVEVRHGAGEPWIVPDNGGAERAEFPTLAEARASVAHIQAGRRWDGGGL